MQQFECAVFLVFFLLLRLTNCQQLLANPRCNHWPDRGPCDVEFTVKWYYDRYDHRCRRFFYGGCDGNENRFDSLEECSSQCHFQEESNKDRCFQPHDPGHCNADIERWFFDENKKQCVCSWWSGCGGNSNIYYSYNHCMLICGEYAEQGPGIDEKYWNRLNTNKMSSESRQLLRNPILVDSLKYTQETYTVKVPADDFISEPQESSNFLKPAEMFTTINISHTDDAPNGYLHKSPNSYIPFVNNQADGVTIHRYDSEPRPLTVMDDSRWTINEQPSMNEKRRFRVSRKRIPPRMIHIGGRNRQQSNSYKIQLNSDEPSQSASYQAVQTEDPETNSQQLIDHHQKISQNLQEEAEIVQKKLQQDMKKKYFEDLARRQLNPQANDQKYHPELVQQFRSHLEEHENKLRMKLEAQFPDHIITLTPQIETIRYPDGRNVVRQRIHWTAHPKMHLSQIPSNQLPDNYQKVGQPQAAPSLPPSQPFEHERPSDVAKPTAALPTMALPEDRAQNQLPSTIAPHELARIQHENMIKQRQKEMEKRRIEHEKRRNEHLKKIQEQHEEHRRKIQEQKEMQRRKHEQMMAERARLQEERRKMFEEHLARQREITITTTPTPNTVLQTTAVYEYHVQNPIPTHPHSYSNVRVGDIVQDATVHNPRPTSKSTAEAIEHYRPIIEHITAAPLSLEEIIAMDNERSDYEDDYDVPMDFPDTEMPPTRAPPLPQPTVAKPVYTPAPNNVANQGLAAIVMPPTKSTRKSKLFGPIESEEYTQDLDFDRFMKLSLLFIFTLISSISAGDHNTVNTWDGVIQYDEDWGYADIRNGAHTFWWLFAKKPADPKRPLFVWLQGGPGSSSTGFGNMEETGPKTLNGSDNQATWLQVADLVYVDNPVGAGFSYVDDLQYLTTNIEQIGEDLLAWLRKFLVLHPEYRTRPFYIFCESYGGKMSTQFAKVITDAIKKGNLSLNFKAVALGDSWISAMDYVNTWGPYLYANSYLDDHQLATVQKLASRCQSLVDQQKWSQATNCWSEMEELISSETNDVSWYNILKKGGTDDWSSTSTVFASRLRAPTSRLYQKFVQPLYTDSLTDYMNTVLRQKFGIIPDKVKFGAQSSNVFNYQAGDFMTPIYETVDQLLKNDYNVVVFNGNEDLICNTMGTEMWMNRLTWDGMKSFNSTSRHHFGTKSFPLAGYYKTHQNLQMFWILRAGHMVAYDTPEAAVYMIKEIVKHYN
ncbi:unnamed protein product [Caenorhabditis bovis]|uniref:Retinoid-inducible serine carboxypeptidase n=1 Tax=Caenorhabditis bovis TaxID=2654633 RepID=A0A8S1E8M5_9PELO|nr:unnamed protein product [Caenorhabditis bovis]